ncbi:kallikrein 1-related peptidase b11-like isoform X3 [Mus caroli]|uniref:Kallikrein 1-related peptidase b11-like isoform X3 n=1 Tax=Mus caroli TaxID=10089 RepID=A0A6P5Q7W7_MUSCR|nr:kallikrein 1-related peptidase b11-like isoform X3 [Mus caroli]
MWFLILFLALSLGGIDAAPPVQSRIVGGFKCEKNSQPWHVAVYRYNEYICGGVLLDPNWVLTAAHCYDNQYNVWLGKNKLFQDEHSAQHRLVSKSFPHPGFNMSLLMIQKIPLGVDLSNDLMLLRLSKPADITDVVKPIALPTEEPKLGSTCLASGWGSTIPFKFQYAKDLECVSIKVLPIENCAKSHNKKVTDVMLCAGDMDGGKDTCVGDSGGPLICDGVLHGITSWGSIPCGEPNAPGIYTKLIKFNSWIKDTMVKNA